MIANGGCLLDGIGIGDWGLGLGEKKGNGSVERRESVKQSSNIPCFRANRSPIDAIKRQGARIHNRLDGILRLLDKNKDFYDGTATECPSVLLCELMSEDDPFVPFCESLAIHQVDPQEAQALRKQFDDIGQLSKQVFGRLAGRFNLSMDEEDKSNFSKFLTEYSKCSEPKGMTRHEWAWSFAYNNIISWIVFCYTIELNEERCLGKAMEDPKFRVETAEARIARMNLHQRWDRRFRGARPDVRNCIDFFASLLLRVSFLVAGSRNFFDFDTGRGKGSCEEDIDAALTADTRHAPYNKLVPAVASPWIELARTRVISTLAATFRIRANASKDNPEAHKLWKDLYAMVCPQNDDLKLDYTPDEVSVIIRLAKLAADYSYDCQKAIEKYDNVLPLATIQPSEEPGVDVCDIRPLRDHPFKWRGTVVAWHERLSKRIPIDLKTEVADEQIHLVTFQALEYYRILAPRAPYLRGETDERPPPVKDAGGKVHELGFLLTSSIEPCILTPMTKLIEQLPALNTPDKEYPIEKLGDMFKALNLLATMMNHCEEELSSVEGENLGDIVTDTLLLQRLVCPMRNGRGRFVLERDLIAKTYADFFKSMLTAVWCVKRKADKRDNKTIELGDLKQEIEKMRKKSAKAREDLNADRLRDTQSFDRIGAATTARVESSSSVAPTPQLDSVEGSSRQSENANGAPKGNSESVELSPELADLFRRGTELTREILRRVNACEAVYLGKSKKPPKYILSATFDSKTGPSLPYFAETIHVIRNEIADRRPRHGEGLDTFERECQVTLEALRLFFVRLSVYLDPACSEKLKKSLYVFRVAEGRFFKQLREGCTLIGSVFESIVSEGVGLNTASVYLDQMADALREREGQLGIGDSGVGIGDSGVGIGNQGLMPKVEDLTRVVKEGFEEIKGEFATAHKEHQKIDKEVVGTRRGLGAVLRHITDWKNIVREMLSKRKIPWGKVEKAVGEDRYGKVDWSKIKHKDGIRQIKDVIDYTYDVKPVTLGVSKKNLKATGGITLADACKQTAILHAEEWAKFTDPYPKGKGLYVACYDLATRKREANPFKTV